MFRHAFAVTTALSLAGVSAAASAVEITGHTPVKLLTQGKPTSPVVKGTVLVQVLVSATGKPISATVKKSTNAMDDAPALEVAKSSTYSAAINDGKPNTEFYDFNVNFTTSGVAALPAGPLGPYEALIRENKFGEAKSGLTTYLAANPASVPAQLNLGLADTFLNDFDDAAALFVKIDTIPAPFKAAARRSLYESAVSSVNAKHFDLGMAYAKKAVAVDPDYVSYAALGSASLGAGDAAGAVSALDQSRTLASSATATERASIDINLVGAELAAGQTDKAKASADEAKSLDPKSKPDAAFGTFYANQAKSKEAAGDLDAAGASYEMGAQADSDDAVTLYTDAAFEYLKMKPAANAKAKADADQALALNANDSGAMYADGVALANLGQTKAAIAMLTNADAAAKAANQTERATQIETSLKQLSPTK